MHCDAMLRYECGLTAWKKKGSGDPPVKPEEPLAVRYWCDDLTVEALARLLRDNCCGLLMARDELAGWMGTFDRYCQGKGGDAPRWLEMFGGRSMVIDRKTGDERVLHVPMAAVSVTGGIQRAVLRNARLAKSTARMVCCAIAPNLPSMPMCDGSNPVSSLNARQRSAIYSTVSTVWLRTTTLSATHNRRTCRSLPRRKRFGSIFTMSTQKNSRLDWRPCSGLVKTGGVCC